MTPLEIITATNAALELVQALLPTFQSLNNSGTVTPEQQAAVKAKIDALRVSISGPEWQHS